MHLQFSRLRWPEWLVGLGGVLLLAALLLMPWYTTILSSGPPGPKYFTTASLDGWHGLSHARWLMVLTILAALALVFFQARERAPALPVAATAIVFPLASLTLAWLIVRVWISPPGGRGIGGWVGILSAAAMIYGAYWSIRTEGINVRDAPGEIPAVELRGQAAGQLQEEGKREGAT